MEEDDTPIHPAPKPIIPTTPPPKGGYIMSRIFFEPVEAKILYDLLEQICQKTEKHYIFNELAYRRMKFLNLHVPFLNTIVRRYQSSKQFYVTRKQTYQTFLTIVKQLCHHNRIPVTSSVQYFESTYMINYFIPYRDGADGT